MTTNELAAQIESAFAAVEQPPHWCLVDSQEGDEPGEIASKFKDVPSWKSLTAEFLDGLGPALAFFTDEAFRYYLPSFLIASARNQTTSNDADPLFHLTYGLGKESAGKKINPRRYGERTFEDCALHRFSTFDKAQAQAIVSYLNHEFASPNRSDLEKKEIREALARYWSNRT